MHSEEHLPNMPQEEEKPRTVEDIIAVGERIIHGNVSGSLEDFEEVDKTVPVEDSTGDFDAEDLVILDLNDERVSQTEREQLMSWMEGHLGTALDQASVRTVLESPDQTTTVTIFDKPLGVGESTSNRVPWYFSKWQNEGEQPFYVLWSQEMYQQQEEEGFDYTRIQGDPWPMPAEE